MKLNRPVRIILGVVLVPPLLFIVLFVVVLVWPTDPLPIEEVFLGACGQAFNSGYIVSERPHSYSLSPQGVWYEENSEVNVSPEAASEIYSKLNSNNEFIYKNGSFEKFVVGKVLANCNINIESGQVTYKYVLW